MAHVDIDGGLWSYAVSYVSSLLTFELPGFPDGESSIDVYTHVFDDRQFQAMTLRPFLLVPIIG